MDPYTESGLYCGAFDYPIDGEVDCILEVAASWLGRSPQTVFEPMCGNARYGRLMARRGLDYLGFDLSAEMLAGISDEPGMKTLVMDATDFSLDADPYDLAICPINSIRHLSDFAALESHLNCVRRHLVSDGLYWVETNLADLDGPVEFDEHAVKWSVPQGDGSTVVAEWWTISAERQAKKVIEGCRFRRLVDEKVVQEIEHEYEMLMTSRAAWEELAEKAGFKIVSMHLQEHDGWKQLALEEVADNHQNNHAICLQPTG